MIDKRKLSATDLPQLCFGLTLDSKASLDSDITVLVFLYFLNVISLFGDVDTFLAFLSPRWEVEINFDRSFQLKTTISGMFEIGN